MSRDKVHVKYRKIYTADLKYDDKFLERGTYGDVRKATWQDKSVAVKMFSCAERKGGFSEELVCLSMLHEHANIVNLHGAHLGNSHTDRPFLVLEFAPYSLEKVLHHCRRELKYTVDHVMSWTVQMAIALDYIHSQDMLHRDIKPSNILLFQDGCVLKLCDFGTARKLEHTLTNAVGTSWYMAPEVIRGTYYTPSCDVYSFGVVLWEMITRHKPYLSGTRGKSMPPHSVLYKVANGGRPPMISRLPKCLEQLIKRCWDEGSHKRPTTIEVKSKMERLVELVKIERGKPFIHRRRQKEVEMEAESKDESQGDIFALEGRDTQHESSDYQKSSENKKDESSSASHSPVPPPTSSSPPPSSSPSHSSPPHPPPPPPTSSPSHSTPLPSSPAPLSSTPTTVSSTTSSRPQNITSTPISSQSPLPNDQLVRESRSHTFTTASNTRSPSERHLHKQQSSPAVKSPCKPGHMQEPIDMSNSYPRGKLSPFLDQRRLGQLTPSNQSIHDSSSTFSPSLAHQDSNMSVASTVIEREGEEENVVSQKQRQQWFRQVEERSKSGEWDSSDTEVLASFPKAQCGTSPFAIPGLEADWQPVLPDPDDPDSMNYYHRYKEAAQQALATSQEISILTELCAQLDREIAGDESNLGRNESSRKEYQALLNQKDVMMRELQEIHSQLKLNQPNMR